MEIIKNNIETLSKNDLMCINGGGPITSTSLVLGAFGVASAGIAIGLAAGAAYYYSTH